MRMKPNFPPQPQDFMAEATEAAARMNQAQVNMDADNAARAMNAQAAERAATSANVYGTAREVGAPEANYYAQEAMERAPEVMIGGVVTGAAEVKGPNAYVDQKERGELYKQYAYNGNVARQQDEQQAAFIREQSKKVSDDKELIDA